MADGKSRTDQAAHLGRRAEAVACGKDVSAPEDGEALSPAAARQTLRELRACQTELAVQREELRGALAELDAARARYAELSSECKQAEARLRASEAGKREQEALARYSRQLIETSLDPLATISPEGIITDVNAASERVTGLSRQRLVGSHFAAHFTEPERARAGYREVLAQGRVIDYPLTFRHLSGACTEVLYNAAVYRDEQGHVVGVFAAARVSGAHRRAEAALLASEIRYRTPAEMTETGYLVLNAQGRVLHANQEYVRISGHGELRDILGKSVMEWTPEESRQDHAAAVAQCLRNGSLRDFVTEYVARGG
jgi:PAS domain S-box-containing protein